MSAAVIAGCVSVPSVVNRAARRNSPASERFGHRRQRAERDIVPEYVIGGEHMQVWVEVGQVPEGLHEQDQARPYAGAAAE